MVYMKEYTKQGKLKTSLRKLTDEWTTGTWNKLGEDIFENSFTASALNLNVNGSDDSRIDCFKQDQLYATGYEKLQRQLYESDSTFNANPFSESYIEEAVLKINLIGMDTDEVELVDIE